MVVLDIVKAVAAILIARYGADLFALRFGDVAFLAWREGGAAVGCLLGHCFPLWSRGLRSVASMMQAFVRGLLWLGILGMLWGVVGDARVFFIGGE